jgi:hypothetical protein
MLERERKIAIRLLITGSGVRVPHNPLKELLLLYIPLRTLTPLIYILNCLTLNTLC